MRKLVDHCRLNILCIGLENTYSILAKDPQVTGRGLLPYHEVRPYSWDSDEERKRFRLLCLKFDEHMPFNQRTGLESAWFAERLYLSSDEGIIGRLSEFLFRAGCLAINDGSDAVETQHFAEAYEEIKKRGVNFNPWVHDPSQAPKPEKKVIDRQPREVCSKKRPPKVEV